MSFTEFTRPLTRADGIIPQAWREEVAAAILERALPVADQLPSYALDTDPIAGNGLKNLHARSTHYSYLADLFLDAGFYYWNSSFVTEYTSGGASSEAMQNAAAALSIDAADAYDAIRSGIDTHTFWNVLRVAVLGMTNRLWKEGLTVANTLKSGDDTQASPPAAPADVKAAAQAEHDADTGVSSGSIDSQIYFYAYPRFSGSNYVAEMQSYVNSTTYPVEDWYDSKTVALKGRFAEVAAGVDYIAGVDIDVQVGAASPTTFVPGDYSSGGEEVSLGSITAGGSLVVLITPAPTFSGLADGDENLYLQRLLVYADVSPYFSYTEALGS